jgi:hypothetical protein
VADLVGDEHFVLGAIGKRYMEHLNKERTACGNEK